VPVLCLDVEGALALKGEGPLYTVDPEVKKKWPDQWGKKA